MAIQTTKSPVTIYVYKFNRTSRTFTFIKKIRRNIYDGRYGRMAKVIYNKQWYYLHFGFTEKKNGKLKTYYNRKWISI